MTCTIQTIAGTTIQVEESAVIQIPEGLDNRFLVEHEGKFYTGFFMPNYCTGEAREIPESDAYELIAASLNELADQVKTLTEAFNRFLSNGQAAKE